MEGAEHISEISLDRNLEYVFALGKKVRKVKLVGPPENISRLLAVYLDARYVRAKLGEFNTSLAASSAERVTAFLKVILPAKKG